MKTLKYMLWGVILSSLVFSSFSINIPGKNLSQTGKVTFCETYTVQEVISRIGQDDHLFNWIRIEQTDPESSRLGRCHQDNVDALLSYTRSQAFRTKAQKDLNIVPGDEAKDQMIALYAVRMSSSNEAFPSQQDLKEVSVTKNGPGDNYSLLITFSDSGADKWAAMTRENNGRDIAMLFRGKVISAPRVREEITGGKCSISGNYTESEIIQLKAVLEN